MRNLILIAAAGLSLAAPASAAVLVQYDFTGDAGNQATEAAVNVATGLTGLAFTRGPGLTAAGATNSFSSAGFSTDTAVDFLSFGFTVAGGTAATVNQLIFGSRSSNTGPGTINVLAAVDGGTFAQVGSYTLPAETIVSQTFTLGTPLVALSRLEFRFVAGNATAANGNPLAGTGTFRVTNFQPTTANTAFTIDGSLAQVAAVPEPSTWAMMIAGFGLVGGVLRRRRGSVHGFA